MRTVAQYLYWFININLLVLIIGVGSDRVLQED